MDIKAIARFIKHRVITDPRCEPRVAPELDLEAPLMVPKAVVVRALLDRMMPGREIILRSRDLEVPWEIEHLCNRLGHELVKVEREGATCWFTLRARETECRLAFQDPFGLELTPQVPVTTIDVPRRNKLKGPGRGISSASGAG
ncbi:MAG: hypothetical protein GXP58_05745 [Deltaproteobacteria bacterium]|nr:hypothetical protein [Deltaproteobacteria bacterium]